MQISISNVIGSIINSGGSAPPITETYAVSNCIYGSPVRSIEYPQGTFQLNDRVTYEYNGLGTFGNILNPDTETSGIVEIYSTGFNSQNCFDNTIHLNGYNSYDGDTFRFIVEFNSESSDFISENNEYQMFAYYFNRALVLIDVGYGEQDEREVVFSGTQILANYNFTQGGDYEIIGRSQSFVAATVIGYSEQNIAIELGFNNINSYTSNDCDYHYFLRYGSQLGSTFYADFRNDNC